MRHTSMSATLQWFNAGTGYTILVNVSGELLLQLEMPLELAFTEGGALCSERRAASAALESSLVVVLLSTLHLL